ncbi:MAG: amidohydrolase family protein [Acidimicrobiales bacterium]|nr:amidohydrolase family protein [Acidimicrobiales bacterium]
MSNRLLSYLFKGGEVVDQNGRRYEDVAVSNGMIVKQPDDDAIEIDISGCVMSAGLVDLSVNFGEPGSQDVECVDSGSRAAARGGFTAVLNNSDIFPVLDGASVLAEVESLFAKSVCEMRPSATITIGAEGLTLAPLRELSAKGVRWFSDREAIENKSLLRNAMEYSSSGSVISVRPQSVSLSAKGAMHEGKWSAILGVAGEPSISETSEVAAIIDLANVTGARVHLDRISTAESVQLLREAKGNGVEITSSVTIQHLIFTDKDCVAYDPMYRADPPYRSDGDRKALILGVKDRTIDVVVSDHRPATTEAKELAFDQSAKGVAGIEATAALLMGSCDLELEVVLDALSWRPAKVAGFINHGNLVRPGNVANLTVLNPKTSWKFQASEQASRGRNNPYFEKVLTGRVIHTICRGELVVTNSEVVI